MLDDAVGNGAYAVSQEPANTTSMNAPDPSANCVSGSSGGTKPVTPRIRRDYNAGDFWCVGDGCEEWPRVMVLCHTDGGACGARFACREHRELLRISERRKRHLRSVRVYDLRFAGWNTWPFTS